MRTKLKGVELEEIEKQLPRKKAKLTLPRWDELRGVLEFVVTRLRSIGRAWMSSHSLGPPSNGPAERETERNLA